MDITTTLTLLQAGERLSKNLANPRDLARLRAALDKGYEYLDQFSDEEFLFACESLKHSHDQPQPGQSTKIQR